MKFILSALLSAAAFNAFAEEPGYFKIETPPITKPSVKLRLPSPVPPAPLFPPPLLADKFLRARGLKAYEVQTLHYNRVACGRRLFSQSGLSVEGDADLKATNVGADLTEIEFPAYINLQSFNSVNPFNNGVESLETMTGRRLVKTHPWPDKKALVLTKKVTVGFSEPGKKAVIADAVAEIRVTEESYPSIFVIKETILLPKPFSIYYICR